MDSIARYNDALSNIPAPGCGKNFHTKQLGIANLGVIAGLSAEQIFQDIRANIPQGNRRVSDREIQDAVSKALNDHTTGNYIPKPRPKPLVNDGKTALQRIIDQGKYSDEADLWEASPIRLWDEPQRDPGLLLKTLYENDELVWIDKHDEPGIVGKNIKTVEALTTHFETGSATAPHIILNPLTGLPVPKKTGDGVTYRGDGNIKDYRFCVVEFDNLNREEQIRFWSAVKLPIVALIDTGGKSIHAWLEVSKLAKVETAEQWQSEIKTQFYDRLLIPMGVDAACSNPARLSRLPGHYREEKGAYQRLLWLSETGRAIAC